MTAYRNDVDALAAREQVLAREVADKQRERDEVQRLLDDARIVEAAEAHRVRVALGRHRSRRVGIVLAGLVVAGIGAGAAFAVHRHPVPVAASEPEPVEVDETRFGLALAAKGLSRIELEPRFVAGTQGLATPGEVDAALGQSVAPWEQFTYTRDAHARQAIASPLYRGGDVDPDPEMVADGYGGVWRVVRDIPRPAARAPAGQGWLRKVWLLPMGSVYRGDVQVAYPR